MLSILALPQEQQTVFIQWALSAKEANRVGEPSIRSLDHSENNMSQLLKEESDELSCVPCRARGMPLDHNFKASLEQK
jgi:hypothetical protein